MEANTAPRRGTNPQSGRSHVCEYCNRAFRKFEHLQRHVRTHTKEKPYKCHCGSAFTRRDLLRRHERLSHKCTSPSSPTLLSPADPPDARVQAINETSPRASSHSTAAATPATCQIPLPPEYQQVHSAWLEERDTQNPLRHFEAFLKSSGLRSISNRLGSSTGMQNDPGQSDLELPATPQLDSANPFQSVFVGDAQGIETFLDDSDNFLSTCMTDCPTFSLPPIQSIDRYTKSYFQFSHCQVIHRSVASNQSHVSMRLAMLALGAWHLFESKNATMLFQASRTIALKLWTSHQSSTLSNRLILDLATTFLLLIELLKLSQPILITAELHILHSALMYYLELIETSHNHTPNHDFDQWVEAETMRRICFFGFCTSASNQVLFGCPLGTQINQNIYIPCSTKLWESTASEFSQHQADQPLMGDPFIQVWDTFSQATNHESPSGQIDLSSDNLKIIATLLMQRLSLLRDVSRTSMTSGTTGSIHLDIEQEARRCLSVTKQTTQKTLLVENTEAIYDTISMVRLLYSRLALGFSPCNLRSLRTGRSTKFAKELFGFRPPNSLNENILSSALEQCVDMLQNIATRGATYFIRTQVTNWSLDAVISSFESIILLSEWIYECNGSVLPQEDETLLLNTIQEHATAIWLSIETPDAIPPHGSRQQLALSYLKIWLHILQDPANKPFVILLGQSLSEYSALLNDSITT